MELPDQHLRRLAQRRAAIRPVQEQARWRHFERDDHFFESTTFLDCVAQCERSRRLTIRAVDLLTQPHSTSEYSSDLFPSRSTPQLPLSESAATLTDNLTSNFTKQHAQESFQVTTRCLSPWSDILTPNFSPARDGFSTETSDCRRSSHRRRFDGRPEDVENAIDS